MNDTFNYPQQLKCIAWNQNFLSFNCKYLYSLKGKKLLSSQSFVNNWKKIIEESALFLIKSPNKE